MVSFKLCITCLKETYYLFESMMIGLINGHHSFCENNHCSKYLINCMFITKLDLLLDVISFHSK